MRKSAAIALGLLLSGGALWGQQYLIATVAGGGVPSTPAPAASVAIGTPYGVAVGANGSVYFTASNCVFKVDSTGILTRVAGASTAVGYSGDGGLATSAQFNGLGDVAVDALGNLYLADTQNNAIRKVAVTGIVTTLAAGLNYPSGVAVDASGNVYIADSGNHVIRKVAATTGIITTVAGSGIQGFSGDGGPATAAQFWFPERVAVDARGNLYISDSNRIREVSAATGIIKAVAGTGINGYSGDGGPATDAEFNFAQGVAVDSSGNLYIADLDNGVIRKVDAATGIISTISEGLLAPLAVAVDASGSLYVADASSSSIRKLAAGTRVFTTVAGNGAASFIGDGGPATSAQLNQPFGVAVDVSGNLYIADSSNNRVRKVAAATRVITTVAGNGSFTYSGDGGPATSASLREPYGVAVDGSGNLYISDTRNHAVRKVAAATGVITTVAGNGTLGSSGDGGPATSAQLGLPQGIAVDGAGNLYIVDSVACEVRKVTAATGIITTVAGNGTQGNSGDGGLATRAQLSIPLAVAVDSAGNLYIADSDNWEIRKVSAATGVITTVAGNGAPGYTGDGGPAALAQLSQPAGVAVDGSGNLYIADAGNNAVRKVTATTGIITTIAGNATNAQFGGPYGVAVDASGNVYVVDHLYSLIRMLVPGLTHALLSIASTHSTDFTPGQADALYSVVVTNTAGAGPTSGTVTVTEALPPGLTLVSMSGAGWTCSGATCTRSDVLTRGSSYPPIAVTVNVASDAPAQVTNEVIVTGGGSTTGSATDLTTISSQPVAPALVSPANEAGGVLVAPTLVWSASAGASSYDVHFGTSSAPPLVATTSDTNFAPGPLLSGATYYWQVAARNDVGSAASATWSFTTGVPATGARFVPVTPCRVADTRSGVGPGMAAGSTRSFAIPQSGCNIPATAQAYALNVTAVPDGPLHYLTIWAAGQPQPFVSTVNAWDGTVVANAAIVAAGSGGGVSVFVSDQTDVVLDVAGYFDATGNSFYTAAPCRVADTRGPTGQFGGPFLGGGQTRDFPIPLGPCPIPATATAYSLNVTAVPDSDSLGYLTTWPTGSSRPLVSTLNSWTGKVVANAALVQAGTNGSASVFVTDPADVVLDVNGYFGPPGGVGALAYYPVTPCRLADTRGGQAPMLEAGTTRTFAVPAAGCGVPSNAAAYAVNITAVPEGPLSYLTAWPTGAPQPFVSTLNSSDGAVVANGAIVPAGINGAISIFVSNRSHVILDLNGYFAP
jgi:uncharacterized repeat protein (TIGR01451 family)